MKLKILSYNIHKGFDLWGRWTLEDMKMALRTTSADALLLQEVIGESPMMTRHLKTWPNERQFEFLADEVWPHFSYGKNAVFPKHHHGNAILSKYPIIHTENIDLSTNRWESRGLLCARILIPEIAKPLHLLTTHLNLLSRGRKVQCQQIIDWIQKNIPIDDPLILAGDFNDWNQSLTSSLSQHLDLREGFLETQKTHAKTFPAILPQLKLDRFYFKNLQSVNFARTLSGEPWSRLSDHLPLYFEVEIN